MNAPSGIAAGRQTLETRAELTFAEAPGGRTYLARQFVPYPFHITRPFYLDREPADLATVYLQSASGGAYRGDHLSLAITLEQNAKAQVTTQASTLVNAGRGGRTLLEQDLILGNGSFLEYLPDPLILMAEADCESRTTIRVAEGADLVASEAFLTHDYRGLGRLPERFLATLQLHDSQDRRLFADRILLGRDGYDFRRMGEYPCCASFMVFTAAPRPNLIDALRGTLASAEGLQGGVSTFAGDRGHFVRLLTGHGAQLTTALTQLWQCARKDLFGVSAVPRRK